MKNRFKKSRSDYPAGILAIYDNGGKTADRYCVVFSPAVTGRKDHFTTLTMSVRPYHPQGVGITAEHQTRPTQSSGDRVISLESLPDDCRQCVQEYMSEPAEAADCPGYPGPCPDGMDWSEWLAMNNVD